MTRPDSFTHRLVAGVSAMALALGCAMPAARAQPAAPAPAAVPAPPPPSGSASSGSPAVDPPARVGRIGALNGTVSFHVPTDTTWSAATLNYPVSNGDGLWTEPGAGASIEVSGNTFAMSDSTEVAVETLDAKGLSATEAQGELFVQLAALQSGETVTLRTPRGTVTLAAVGQYEIAAGDTSHPTVVSVVRGAADIAGEGLSLHVTAGQAATVNGTDKFDGTVAALARDAFLTASLARFAPANPAPGAVAPPAIVAAMTGSADLDRNGSWRTSPEYGTVWYPRVAAGWRPYHDGHWSWVAPWGWTWIDDQPWGFAPSHYGRWVDVDNAWAWVPAAYQPEGGGYVTAEPIYAPALVAFFGVGVAVGTAVGFGGYNSVAWVPLGPGEPYRPWYGHSDGYFRSVNVRNVTNVANITNVSSERGGLDGFRNRGAAIVAPAGAILASQRIGSQARGLPQAQLAAVRPISTLPQHPVGGVAAPRLDRPGPAIGPVTSPVRAGAVALRQPGGGREAVAADGRGGGPAGGATRPGGVPALRAAEPSRPGGRETVGAEARGAGPAAGRELVNRGPATEANRAEAPREQRTGLPQAARPAEPRAIQARPAVRQAARPQPRAPQSRPQPHFAQARPASHPAAPRAVPHPAAAARGGGGPRQHG